MADFPSPYWYSEQNNLTGAGVALRLEHKIVEKQSPFHKVEIYQTTDFGYLMVIDGCAVLSSLDSFFYHEMITHPALFCHAKPKNVLIIGGGDGGSLQQVLKHSEVERVVQVYQDTLITQVTNKYFPHLSRPTEDSRVEQLFSDGLTYVQQLEPSSFDIIIVDSTDVKGPCEGFYNQAFYKVCLSVLTEHGILVQQSGSPLLHQTLIKTMREDMLAVGFSQQQTLLFPKPIYPSGYWSCTMATKAGDFRLFRGEDAAALAPELQYYNTDMHQLSSKLPNFLSKKL